MKKWLLLAIVLFPVYGWGHPVCPAERPFLSEEIDLDYFHPILRNRLQPLSELGEPQLKEVPDFQFEAECQKTKDPLCEKLNEVKEYQKKFKEWSHSKEREELQQENEIIRYKNEIINAKNGIFDSQNKLYGLYSSKSKVSNIHDGYIMDPTIIFGPENISNPIVIDIQPKNSLQKAIKDYITDINPIISSNINRIKHIEELREKNNKIENRNAKIEQENAEIEKRFQTYYTSEKTVQLLNDYQKAIAEKCVGCDYPEPLLHDNFRCREICPNREYVDGKCVLKKETQK